MKPTLLLLVLFSVMCYCLPDEVAGKLKADLLKCMKVLIIHEFCNNITSYQRYVVLGETCTSVADASPKENFDESEVSKYEENFRTFPKPRNQLLFPIEIKS